MSHGRVWGGWHEATCMLGGVWWGSACHCPCSTPRVNGHSIFSKDFLGVPILAILSQFWLDWIIPQLVPIFLNFGWTGCCVVVE